MDATLSIQQNLKEVIERTARDIQATPKTEWTAGLIRSRLETLERRWSSFEDNHVSLLNSETPRDHPYFAEKDYEAAETTYTTAKGYLYDAGDRVRPTHSETSPSPADGSRGASRLPRIVIPPFDGRQEEWESFRDLFRSLIHSDPSLSKVDKFYYLKTYVQGEAKSAIDSLKITDANYDIAWESLESQYDYQRLLVQDHLKALKSLSHIKVESSAGLRRLHDQLKRHHDQLRTLGRPVDQWDDWFVSFACDAMDLVTQRDWEEELETLSVASGKPQQFHPSFDELTSFSRRRIRTLRSVESKPSRAATPGGSRGAIPTTTKPKGFRILATGLDSCVACGKAHYLGHCPQFRGLPTDERRRLTDREHLCFNCLRREHGVRSCPTPSSCRDCGGRHHTLLHREPEKRSGPQTDAEPPTKRGRIEDVEDPSPPAPLDIHSA